MKMRVRAVLTGFAVAVLAACSGTTSGPSLASAPPTNKPQQAPRAPVTPAADLACLSPRDTLAQLLMVGVTGGDDARAVVRDYHVGGIFIGSWTNLSMLTDGSLPQITTGGPIPAAVSVDEEGGRVSRLSSLIGKAPSARSLAASQTPEQAQALANERSQKIRGLGVTVNFAPVVDVTNAADDTVIGDRSYSADPAVVTRYAGAVIQGTKDAGVLPVLKHFPGHGHASGDSHTGGVVTPPLDQLQDNDLVPYRTLVTSGAAVMIGHMQVPGLTGDDPASLSPAAVALLRNGSGYNAPGFDGPIFSDDLSSMAAISDRFPIEEAVLRALQGGIDVALWVSTDKVGAVLDRLESAYNAGELNPDAVAASVHRVLGFKGVAPPCGG